MLVSWFGWESWRRGHSATQAWHAGEGMVTGTGHWIGDKSKALWHKIF
ncbi:hypothetical protein ACFC8N_46730 [Streptomyces sp. NPDC055966]